jgi:hypothetical protein
MGRSEGEGSPNGGAGRSARARLAAISSLVSFDVAWQVAMVAGLVLGSVVLIASDGADLAHDLRQQLLRVDPFWTLVGVALATFALGVRSLTFGRNAPSRPQTWAVASVPVVALLGLIFVSAATFRVLLVRAATEPRVFGDELIYSGLAKGLALDGRPLFRGEPDFTHSLLYPLLLSPGYALAQDGAVAFEAMKTVDAVVVTLTAVPAYLLARRVVDPVPGLVVAALVAFEPWTAYASLAMTESLFLPVFTTFVLLLARMLDRPTPLRQFAVLVALIALIGIRPQALVLVLAVVAAIGIQAIRGPPSGRTVRTHAFILGVLALLTLALALSLVVGVASPGTGGGDVAESLVDPAGLVKWTLWNLAVYELSLGVLALVLFPLALDRMLRSPDERTRATAIALAVTSIAIALSVAAVSASPSGLGVLHERYLFYLTPLVLVGTAYWLQTDVTLSRRGAAIAGIAAVAIAATLPAARVAAANNLDSPTGAWLQALHETMLPGIPIRIMVAALAMLGALVLVTFRRPSAAIVSIVVAFTLLVCGLDYSGPFTEAQDRQLAWVDRAMPGSGRASLVHLGYTRPDQPCGAAADREQQQLVVLTEFFNTRINRVFHVGEQVERDNLPSPLLTVGPGGVVLENGKPFAPAYAVLDSRQPVVGTPLARLDLAGLGSQYQAGSSLALWKVDPPLRFLVHAQPLPPRADGGQC